MLVRWTGECCMTVAEATPPSSHELPSLDWLLQESSDRKIIHRCELSSSMEEVPTTFSAENCRVQCCSYLLICSFMSFCNFNISKNGEQSYGEADPCDEALQTAGLMALLGVAWMRCLFLRVLGLGSCLLLCRWCYSGLMAPLMGLGVAQKLGVWVPHLANVSLSSFMGFYCIV